jgi:hypothetical protein
MVTEKELFESPDLNPLGFCLWGWMKSGVNKTKVDTADELLLALWMLLAA